MSAPPSWIVNIANSVAAHLEPLDPMPPLGCHYHLCDSSWEISLFPSQTEIVGGAQDGHQTAPRFFVDVLAIARLFSRVDELTWQSKPVDESDQLGSHIAIGGVCEGESVSIRILRSAPRGFDPGRKAMVHDGCLIETW